MHCKMISFGAAVLLQLLSSFSQLDALEMPMDLMHDGLNIPKSGEYARHIAFPLQTDGSVEMPPNVEDDFEFTTKGADSEERDYSEEESATKSGLPMWIEPHQNHHQHQSEHFNYHSPTQPPQHHKHMDHHHSNRQPHTSSSSSSSASPLRRCSIEISSKIPGICQSMGSIGNACVSGDYIDVFNAECS